MADTDGTSFAWGIVLCTLGSWLVNIAHICLKEHNRMNDKRARQNLPEKCSAYNVGYWVFFLFSVAFDIASMKYLHQIMWCTVSAFDVLWYNFFVYWFYDRPFDGLEVVAIFFFLTGALFCTVWEPATGAKVGSGWEQFADAFATYGASEIIFFSIMACVMIGGTVYILTKFNQRNQNIEPEPTSFFNCAGIICNGIAMAFYAMSLYILVNTIFTPTGEEVVNKHILYSALLFLPFFFISGGMEWTTANCLHYKTQIMAVVMVSTMVQLGTNYFIWGISFQNSYTYTMWWMGLGLEISGLIGWILVQQYLKDLSEKDRAMLAQVTVPAMTK